MGNPDLGGFVFGVFMEDLLDIVVSDPCKLISEVLLAVRTKDSIVLEINTRLPYTYVNEFYTINKDGSREIGINIYPDELAKNVAILSFSSPFLEYLTFIKRDARELTLAVIARDSEQEYGVLYRHRD